MSERRPQHDAHAERAVLGAAMVDAECALTVREMLRAADFYEPKHATIFNAIETLAKSGLAVDTLLVRSQLHTAGMLEQVGGEEYLMELAEHIATADSTVRLSKRVQQLAMVRRVEIAARRLAEEARQPIEDLDDYLDRASSVISSVCRHRGADLEVISLADALHEAFTDLAQRERSGEALLGVATGFADLDHAIGGLTPGDLIILAARPAIGKTALATAIKLGVARSTGRPVLSLELEMTRQQLAHRVMSIESGVELRRIRAATLSKQDLSDIARSADNASKLPVHFIEKRGVKISELRKAARLHAATNGPLALITVDYLQIAKAERREEQRDREVSEITGALKSLAGEMSCPVLALSQLNRKVESRTDKRPMLGDLRESGAIEQDADTVLFLYRDEVYNPDTPDAGIAEVIIGKQRSGPIGTVRLRWSKELTRFQSLFPDAPDEPEEPQGKLSHVSNGRSNGRSTNGYTTHDEG